jgi:hypothetical protein
VRPVGLILNAGAIYVTITSLKALPGNVFLKRKRVWPAVIVTGIGNVNQLIATRE